MGGLDRLCKLYGRLEVTDKDGKKAMWVYDHTLGKSRLESEMTYDERKESEKARWLQTSKK